MKTKPKLVIRPLKVSLKRSGILQPVSDLETICAAVSRNNCGLDFQRDIPHSVILQHHADASIHFVFP